MKNGSPDRDLHRLLRSRCTYSLPVCLSSALLTVTVLLTLQISPAHANDTAVGGIGGVVYPLTNTDIRMEAETVQVVCHRSFAQYRIDFRFVNEGPPQTVRLGFPFVVTESGDLGSPPTAFQVWQDDKRLRVTMGRGVSSEDLMSGVAPLGYYLHEATFPRGATVITVNYLAQPTIRAGSRFEEGTPPEIRALNIAGWQATYDYWLHTGAGWSGTIGKTVVRFTLADDFNGWGVDVKMADVGLYAPGSTTSPESYVKLGDRTYQWVFEDFEPTEEDDIVLAFTRPNIDQFRPKSLTNLPTSFGAMATIEGISDEWNSDFVLPVGWEAIDGSPETSWDFAESGADSSLQVGIVGDQRLEEIRVLPGRNDSLTSFYDHGRPKTMMVTLSDGTSATITLKDEPTLQKYAISGKAEWARFQVLDVYPGATDEAAYVSELGLGTEPAPDFLTFAELITEQTSSSALMPTTTLPTNLYPANISSMTTITPGTSLRIPTANDGSTPALGGEKANTRTPVWPIVIPVTATIMLAVIATLLVRLRSKRHGTRDAAR